MTEVNDVQNLNNEIENQKQAIQGLSAQLDASKQMYNDAINVSFQLKTQVILLQKQLQDAKIKEDEYATNQKCQ